MLSVAAAMNAIPSTILPRSDLKIPMPAGVKPPPRSVFRSPFALGDRVHIDDDRDLVARVTGFLWGHDEGVQLRLAWMSNGDSKNAWFEEWRLKAVQEG